MKKTVSILLATVLVAVLLCMPAAATGTGSATASGEAEPQTVVLVTASGDDIYVTVPLTLPISASIYGGEAEAPDTYSFENSSFIPVYITEVWVEVEESYALSEEPIANGVAPSGEDVVADIYLALSPAESNNSVVLIADAVQLDETWEIPAATTDDNNEVENGVLAIDIDASTSMFRELTAPKGTQFATIYYSIALEPVNPYAPQ